MSEYVITVIGVYALFFVAAFWHAIENAKVFRNPNWKGNPCGRFLYIVGSIFLLALLAAAWPLLVAKGCVEEWLQ
jgi:hypothetical protein